jgi:hypothetical protein
MSASAGMMKRAFPALGGIAAATTAAAANAHAYLVARKCAAVLARSFGMRGWNSTPSVRSTKGLFAAASGWIAERSASGRGAPLDATTLAMISAANGGKVSVFAMTRDANRALDSSRFLLASAAFLAALLASAAFEEAAVARVHPQRLHERALLEPAALHAAGAHETQAEPVKRAATKLTRVRAPFREAVHPEPFLLVVVPLALVRRAAGILVHTETLFALASHRPLAVVHAAVVVPRGGAARLALRLALLRGEHRGGGAEDHQRVRDVVQRREAQTLRAPHGLHERERERAQVGAAHGAQEKPALVPRRAPVHERAAARDGGGGERGGEPNQGHARAEQRAGVRQRMQEHRGERDVDDEPEHHLAVRALERAESSHRVPDSDVARGEHHASQHRGGVRGSHGAASVARPQRCTPTCEPVRARRCGGTDAMHQP